MRTLLIRPGAIGDCILWLPILPYLRQEWLEIWISSPVVPLVQSADAVRSIHSTGLDLMGLDGIDVPPKLLSSLQNFDSILSWYGTNRPEFVQAMQNLNARSEFYRALPPPDFHGHTTDFFARQVGAPDGLVATIRVEGGERRNAVVIHPFSGSAKKNWPLDRFQDLARQLALPVEWLAGAGEELAGTHRIEPLDQLAHWVAAARLYIGNDSGITHLAAAAGVPVLALFGPASPEGWQPRTSNATVLRTPSFDDLSVREVLSAANRLLGWS